MGGEHLDLTTADGRRVRGQLAGPEDGGLVVFHMGTPASPYLYAEHVEEAARRGLRHLSLLRPGYAGSDRQPGRSFADCAADVELFLDELGVERAYVLGSSTGADFALACAALLPHRVLSAGALSGFAPWNAAGLDWQADMDQLNHAELAALEAGPAELERFLRSQLDVYGMFEAGEDLVAGFGEAFCPADREALAGDFLDFQLEGCRWVARHGLWGWFEDDYAIWGKWGFDPARIEVPVSLWHGGQDRFVPVAHGKWLAANIPGARLHLLPEEGHLSIFAHRYGDVLDELVAIGPSPQASGRAF